jgi:manganese oxidase
MHCLRSTLFVIGISLAMPPVLAASEALPPVVPNDNRQPAGALRENTLTLNLRAAVGVWRPEGDSGPAVRVEAFGETNATLMTPAPLIRVEEGTTMVVTIRNDLDEAMRVYGLCDRGSSACAPIDIASQEARRVTFSSGRAGTYYYWATTTGMPLGFRGGPDAQLSGAFIVDPPGRGAATDDRVFVITEYTSLTREQLKLLADADDVTATFFKFQPKFTTVMNGLSWPATERLTYQLGDSVRWRVVNLSTQLHPMHLHGFYFELDATGDGSRDTTFADREKQRVVTHLMRPGDTMNMRWTPERVGNWLFHCHRMLHVSPDHRIGDGVEPAAHHDGAHDPSAGMAGMVIGVRVVERPGTLPVVTAKAEPSPRKLTLTVRSEPKRYGDAPAFGFDLREGDAQAPAGPVSVPGPTIVLRRGEPVEISVVNTLAEGTAIHWHGMELESYYDGVHGWSGAGARLAPLIEPGGSFVVRFTPPRTGTFIYHTHLHDNRQLASGLYGAMVVIEPGETFDPAIDHVLVIGRGGPAPEAPVVLNGGTSPSFAWKAGTRHRVRLINITPDDVFAVSIESGDGPATWKPVTKDGAPLPPSQCAPRPARQIISVGETYDFEFDVRPGRQVLWVGVRSVGGKWQVQGRVTLK